MPHAERKKTNKGANRGQSMFVRILLFIVKVIGWVLWLLWRGIVRISPSKEQWAAWARTPQFRRAVLGLVMLLVCFGTATYMRAVLADGPAYQIAPGNVELAELDLSWIAKGPSRAMIDEEIQNSLRASLRDVEGGDAFDRELTARVGEALAANPWVRSVDRVERLFPAGSGGTASGSKLSINLSIRRPVLRVRPMDIGGKEPMGVIYLVDADGCPLPHIIRFVDATRVSAENDALIRSLEGVREVAGVNYDVEPEPGATWANEQISAALSMERTIRSQAIEKIYPVAAIRVSSVARRRSPDQSVNYHALGGVRLVPPLGEFNGVQVLWGIAPVHATSVEATVEAKVAKLKQALNLDPQFALLAQDSKDKDGKSRGGKLEFAVNGAPKRAQ